jgi:hypothetical protein
MLLCCSDILLELAFRRGYATVLLTAAECCWLLCSDGTAEWCQALISVLSRLRAFGACLQASLSSVLWMYRLSSDAVLLCCSCALLGLASRRCYSCGAVVMWCIDGIVEACVQPFCQVPLDGTPDRQCTSASLLERSPRSCPPAPSSSPHPLLHRPGTWLAPPPWASPPSMVGDRSLQPPAAAAAGSSCDTPPGHEPHGSASPSPLRDHGYCVSCPLCQAAHPDVQALASPSTHPSSPTWSTPPTTPPPARTAPWTG